MLRGSVCVPVHKKRRVFRLVYNMDRNERGNFVQVLLVVFFKRGESGGEHLCVAPLVVDWPGFGTEDGVDPKDRLALVMDSHTGWQAANPFSRENRTAVRLCPTQATKFDEERANPALYVQMLPHKAVPSMECYIEEFVNVTVEVRLQKGCKGRRILDFTRDLDAQAPVPGAAAPVPESFVDLSME